MSAAHPFADDELVSTKAFAELVGLDPTRITQLAKQGLPRDARKRVPVAAGRAWIAANVRPKLKAAAPDDPRIRHRAEREKHEAELARMRVEERAGKLISRDEVRAAAFERARFERDAHLGFAARVAPLIAAETGADPAKVFAVLDREMRTHLTGLAETAMPERAP